MRVLRISFKFISKMRNILNEVKKNIRTPKQLLFQNADNDSYKRLDRMGIKIVNKQGIPKDSIHQFNRSRRLIPIQDIG